MKRPALALVMFALFAAPLPASGAPPTKEECFSANEDAQTLRQSKKLSAARQKLLLCVSPACPRAVRDDCTERLDEIERAIPTIVFIVKAGGSDLRDVKVTVDGAPLVDRLDGTGIVVDPGEHVFAFTANGYSPVSKTFVIAEGAKDRNESIELTAAPITEPAKTAAPSEGNVEPPPRDDGDDPGKGRRIFALGVGGAGVVGIGLGAFFALKSKSTYDDALSHCPNGPKSCTQEGVTGGEDAHGQATVSTIAFIAGGALLAGGVVLFLTAPKKSSVGIQPTVGPSVAGLRLGGTW